MENSQFANLNDADLTAVIAYAKTVPPVDRLQVDHRYDPIGRLLLATGQVTLAAEVIDITAPRPATVPVGPTAAYGKTVQAAV